MMVFENFTNINCNKASIIKLENKERQHCNLNNLVVCYGAVKDESTFGRRLYPNI